MKRWEKTSHHKFLCAFKNEASKNLRFTDKIVGNVKTSNYFWKIIKRIYLSLLKIDFLHTLDFSQGD